MCFPAALPIGLALLAGGSGLKFAGEKKAQHAQMSAFNTEHARQEELSAKQQGYFDDSMKHVGALSDPAALAAAQAAHGATLSAAIAPPTATTGAYLPGSSSAPGIVTGMADRAGAATAGDSSRLATTLAALGGTADLQQRTDIGVGRNAGLIGQVASSKANSANVLDQEMRAAAQKGAALRGIGSLAQQIGLAAVASGSGLFGGGVPSSSSIAASAGKATNSVLSSIPHPLIFGG